MSAHPRIEWSDEFAVVDADRPLAELLALLDRDGPFYVVIRRAWDLLYVFRADELLRLPELTRFREREPPPGVRIEDELDLHEHDSSPRTSLDGAPLPYPYAVPPGYSPMPSRGRFAAVDSGGEPAAVGAEPERRTRGGRQPRRIDLDRLGVTGDRPPESAGPEPSDLEGRRRGGLRSPHEAAAGAAPDEDAAPLADEGTDPVRHPSIRADRDLAPGRPVVVTVNLLREDVDPDTASSGVAIGGLAADWSEIEVDVELASSAIDFAGTSGTVRVRRNADSIPATFEGTVRAGLRPGDPARVLAVFCYRGRDCGTARRSFTVGAAAEDPQPVAGAAGLVIETAAVAPALTVRILRLEPSAPGKLTWQLQVPRADDIPNLPDRLVDHVDLGASPREWVTALYRDSESAAVGSHEDLFRGVGDALWERTPGCFRRVYWALRDALGPGFPIQFVTDEPYVPWELVRPYDEQRDRGADILALEHPVARWIADYEGSLRQRLPRGRVVTIAPDYPNVADQLPRAQEEAELLTRLHGARPVPGRTDEVKRLLEEGLADESVGVLHFAGHGDYLPQQPGASSIKLEDGSLPALVVGRREVRLGERDGPLVVFNACKVGATGESLGATGGWAEVFLRRRFRGVVAPLWAVYDEDATVVIEELFDAVVGRGETLGRALQQIRVKHGATSPTFFAYLYYGDVMARMAPAASARPG
jgi:hypothetical protein